MTVRFGNSALLCVVLGCANPDPDPQLERDAEVGQDAAPDAERDSAVQDLGRWRMASLEGAPGPRLACMAVWTGREMIVWGGTGCHAEPCELGTTLADGARYDPEQDSWTSVGTEEAPSPRMFAASAWTGDRMLVWSGHDSGPKGGPPPSPLDDGAWYFAQDDAWEPVPTDGAPISRSGATAFWTGTEILVWGGGVPDENGQGGSIPLRDGARIDPQAGTWAPIAPLDVGDELTMPPFVAWIGTEMVVWDGRGIDAPRRGWRYEPATDSWNEMAVHRGPEASCGVVWTDAELLAFGHTSFSRYDPLSDEWIVGEATETLCATPIWTGREVLLWRPAGWPPGASARFDPATETVAPIEGEGAPPPRSSFVQFWTGQELLVWGGQDEVTGRTSTGYLYRPPDP